MQTLELGYVNAGFLLFAFLLVVTLVVGRFFCGWACHVVAYQDLCAWLLEKVGVRPRPVRARVLRFVPIGAALYMFVWPSVARWWHDQRLPAIAWHLTTDSFWKTFPGPWMAALTLIVDGVLVVWWMGAKGFCTYGCPYGALFGLADRLAVGRIRVTDACEGCGHCTAVCTSNVRVHQEVATFGMVVDSGCMKCLDCVNSCPKEALYFGMGAPSLFGGKGSRAATRSPSSDLSWSEELLTGLTFVVGLYAFRGLYSQVPFLLAIGMATLAAITLVAVKRLVMQRDFQVQWSRWRIGGRFTRAGLLGSALIVAYLLFAVHSVLVQFHGREGERLLQLSIEAPRDVSVASSAKSHLIAALELGLFPDGKVENLLAVCEQRAGHLEAALPHLRRAFAIDPTATKGVALATILMELGQRDAARAALLQALALEPGDPEATRRLRILDGGGSSPSH